MPYVPVGIKETKKKNNMYKESTSMYSLSLYLIKSKTIYGINDSDPLMFLKSVY